MSESVKNTGFYCSDCYHFTERENITDNDIISESVKDELDITVEFILCPICGAVAKEAGLNFRGISKINLQKLQTGPTTVEGRKRLSDLAASRKNINGPNTKEGKDRSSKNAFKHGKYAKKMMELAPANYKKFPFCDECDEETRAKCKAKTIKWCPVYIAKQLTLYSLYVNNDVDGLSNFAAQNQAKLSLALEMMFSEVMKEGVLIVDKKSWENGEESSKSEYTKANPLIEFILKTMDTLGQTSDQQGTNPSKEKENLYIDGNLKSRSIDDEIRSTEKFLQMMEQNKKLVMELSKVSAEEEENPESEEGKK